MLRTFRLNFLGYLCRCGWQWDDWCRSLKLNLRCSCLVRRPRSCAMENILSSILGIAFSLFAQSVLTGVLVQLPIQVRLL